MKLNISAVAVGVILGMPAWPSAAAIDSNFLELGLTKDGDGTGGFWYGFQAGGLGKVGATTCELMVGFDTYTCVQLEDRFLLTVEFFDERSNLTFERLLDEIGGAWTLTWDRGLPTETVASIDFDSDRGDITPDAWPAIFPTITKPLDGASGIPPSTSINWSYDAVPPDVYVFLWGPGNADWRVAAELGGSVTSWTPDVPLSPGNWVATVNVGVDIRDVPSAVAAHWAGGRIGELAGF